MIDLKRSLMLNVTTMKLRIVLVLFLASITACAHFSKPQDKIVYKNNPEDIAIAKLSGRLDAFKEVLQLSNECHAGTLTPTELNETLWGRIHDTCNGLSASGVNPECPQR